AHGGEAVGVALEVQRPALVAGNALADAFPAVAVAVEAAVLDLYPGALRGFGGEADLPFAGLHEVGLDPPVRADVPAEQDAVRRVVGKHAGPSAFAAVDAAVVERAADA